MKLKAPAQGIDFITKDVYGEHFQLSDYLGKRVMLSFFRNAECPLCNFRLYELTHNYQSWRDQGLEIVAIFSSSSESVRKFVARHPRPFKMISDTELEIYSNYGVEKSNAGMWKALVFRIPTLLRGMFRGGYLKPTRHFSLVPGDFLLDESGRIVNVFYGQDISEHIPIDQVERFLQSGRSKSSFTDKNSRAVNKLRAKTGAV